MRAIAFIIMTAALLAVPAEVSGDGTATAGGVRVHESQRYCQSSRQCTKVHTRCGSCDCGVAINQAFAEGHRNNLAAVCGQHEEVECERPCPEARPICVLGICALEPLRGD